MVYYYLDIETYSKGDAPDPTEDSIVTIIFCAIDPKTGKRLQEPVLLKAWEQSEKELVETLGKRMLGNSHWDFIPVGFNTLFDLWMLKAKFKKYLDIDLGEKFYLERPYLDLKHTAVLANQGKFKGVKLGSSGNPVRDWYEYQDYSSIENYCLEKLEKFLGAYAVWVKRLEE